MQALQNARLTAASEVRRSPEIASRHLHLASDSSLCFVPQAQTSGQTCSAYRHALLAACIGPWESAGLIQVSGCRASKRSKALTALQPAQSPSSAGRRDCSCAAAPASAPPGPSAASVIEAEVSLLLLVRTACKPQVLSERLLQDLWQFADRQNWYKAKFVADDAPDFLPAELLRVRQANQQVQLDRIAPAWSWQRPVRWPVIQH